MHTHEKKAYAAAVITVIMIIRIIIKHTIQH